MPPKQPLVKVRPSSAADSGGSLTESGLFCAVTPQDAPLWRDGRNVIFKDGGPQKIAGWASATTLTGAGIIRGAESTQDEAAVQRLFCGDASKLFMWDGSTVYTLKSGIVGGSVNETVTTPATTWSHARFGNWMVSTNGVSAPQIWKTGGTSANLGGSPPATAQIVMRRGPHILLLNTASGQAWVQWSDADNPEVWTPSSTNAAGDINIRDMDGGITAACPIGDQIAVFGKNQMFLLSYTGAPFIFTYKPLLAGIGAVGKCAVASANRRVFGMSRTGFWMTDGTQYQYIDTPAVRDYWTTVVDTTQLSKVCATYDATNDQVIWYLPTSATQENTFALAYRIANGTWTIFDHGRSAVVPQLGVYRVPVAVGTDAKVYFHNTGLDANGAALTAYIQTKPLDAGDPWVQKYVNALLLELRRLAGTVRVRVGTQKLITDAITWGDYRTVDAGYGKLDLRQSGRFISLEVSSASTGADWVWTGFDLYGDFGGRGA